LDLSPITEDHSLAGLKPRLSGLARLCIVLGEFIESERLNAGFQGNAGKFGNRTCIEFLHDATAMHFNSLFGDIEFIGYLFVQHP